MNTKKHAIMFACILAISTNSALAADKACVNSRRAAMERASTKGAEEFLKISNPSTANLMSCLGSLSGFSLSLGIPTLSGILDGLAKEACQFIEGQASQVKSEVSNAANGMGKFETLGGVASGKIGRSGGITVQDTSDQAVNSIWQVIK